MFTHFGVSGPTVLSASTHLRKHRGIGYRMEIDMKPALDDATLDKRLQREFSDNINKDVINSLDALLPKRLIPVIIDKSGVPRNIKCNSVSKAQRDALVRTLKHLSAETCGFRPIEEAVVTAGGVKTSEIDPSTMQSKLIKRLYFTGEVIDVDAYTGGFNLQIAFSTGHLAGSKVFSEE